MRRILIGIVLGVAIAGLAGVGAYRLWRSAGEEGGGDLEQWIGRQVVRILEAHVTPKVAFGTLDYQAPRTVVIDGMSLSTEGQSMIAVERVLIELAEIPRRGEPIVIERIEMRAPQIRFVRSNSDGFVGWSTFVRRRGAEAPEVPADVKLSNVLRMRRVIVEAGQLEFDPNDGSEPMFLRGIDVVLNTPPDTNDPAWHALEGQIQRDDLFVLTYDGRVNLDSGMLEARELTLHGLLGEAQYEMFPPPVQAILRRHQARGELAIELSGVVPVREWRTAGLSGTAELTDGRLVFDEAVLPVERLGIDLELANERLNAKYDARLLEGQLSGTGSLALSGDRATRLAWDLRDVALDAAFKTVSDRPPPYSGRVRSKGTFAVRMKVGPDSIGGGGELQVDNGHLVQLPLFRALSRMMAVKIPGMERQPKDRAAVDFRFGPESVRVEHMELATPFLAARGDGKIYYDSTLDMRIQAGLVNRLEKPLGRVGNILGVLTDHVVTYVVRGTIGNPKVKVSPLGIGSG